MIGFAGLSHLGLVSSIAAAGKGFDIVAFDPDAALCERLSRAELPIVEPGLPELLDQVTARIQFTPDSARLAACDLIYIAPDVATDDQNRVQLEPLRALIMQVAAAANPQCTIVLLSQVPPGFTRQVTEALVQQGLTPFRLYYQVETLIFGAAVGRALHPERFIVGAADPLAPLAEPFQRFLESFGCPILPMRYESAELAKISINVCLVSSIAAANTVAELCESIGADWHEIVPALRLDKRIGPHAYISPGLGLAGGNLERDLATVCALAAAHGTDAGVVESWIANSTHRRNWVLRTLHTELNNWHQRPAIAMWGLAYKADTASTKNSVALELLQSLRDVPVRVYDPQVKLDTAAWPNVTICATPLEACAGAAALAIMTPWAEFGGQDFTAVVGAMQGDLVIDPFGIATPAPAMRYRRLGSPS